MLIEQGQYAEAEACYRRDLVISTERLGAAHPATGTTLNNLGEALKEQGKVKLVDGGGMPVSPEQATRDVLREAGVRRETTRVFAEPMRRSFKLAADLSIGASS